MRKFAVLLTVAFVWSSIAIAVRAEESSEKGNGELAEALESVKVSLDDGLRASEAQGTPISAKFEIEDGKLQLSVYTMKGDKFFEVVADPKTGAIAKAEKITDADDLKASASQKAAMAKAKVPLMTATDTAVKANAGFRAVSIYPGLKGGQATA